jgi:hypothetical protein
MVCSHVMHREAVMVVVHASADQSNTLPTDIHYTVEQLRRLFLKPDLYVCRLLDRHAVQQAPRY